MDFNSNIQKPIPELKTSKINGTVHHKNLIEKSFGAWNHHEVILEKSNITPLKGY